MKRFICTALAATMALSLFSACKPQNQSAVKITPEPETTAVSEVTKAPEPTAEPTEAPTAEPTEVPTATPTESQDLPDIEKNRPILASNILLYGDAFKLDMYGARPHELALQLQRYPTDKRGEAEMKYLIYDIEDGWSGYVFYGNFFDTDIIHSPDYTLIYEDWDAWDVVTNYRIEPIDLPEK